MYVKNTTYWGICGGSYYSNGLPITNASYSNSSLPSGISNNDVLSGFGGCGEALNHTAGCGGQGGKGGNIKVSEIAKIYAYNGSRLNDGNQTRTGKDQAVIYGQLGIVTPKYEWYSSSGIIKIRQKSLQSTIDKVNYINDNMISQKVTINSAVSFLTNVNLSTQGVGSGAGYIEISNGTYIMDSSLN